MTCPHADLLFDSTVSPYPICTLCGNGVRIVADAQLHPFTDPGGGRGLTAVADSQPIGDHVDVTVAGFDDLAALCLRQHFGKSYVQATAHLTPAMAREIGIALLTFAEEHIR